MGAMEVTEARNQPADREGRADADGQHPVIALGGHLLGQSGDAVEGRGQARLEGAALRGQR
jgi:hypothetical protein